MKYTTVNFFEQYLIETPTLQLSNLFLILGSEHFVRKIAIDKVINAILSTQSNIDLCVRRLEAEKVQVDSLEEELMAFPLFGSKQIIVIENTELLGKNVQKFLETYFLRPNSTTFLILSSASLGKAVSFKQKIEKSGVILEIEEEKGAAKEQRMCAWVTQKVESLGKKISQKACQILVKQVGTDMSMLNNEVEKLLCFIGSRKEISMEDIQQVCAVMNMETIWQLGEAIFLREAPKALRISKALMAEGATFLSLLRQLRFQLQTDFQVCSIIEKGDPSTNITKRFPYMKGYILELHMKFAKAYGMARFKKSMQKIDEMELLAKNSQIDENLLTEILITHLVI